MLVSLCCNMDKKIRIIIRLGEARYPVWITPSEEPIFREAGRMVNRRLVAYNTKFRSSALPPEDMLAMTALDLAVLCQRVAVKANLLSSEGGLSDLIAELKEFLNPDEQTLPSQ